tara:strand:- start:310 stop:435 length:126 start_codon:yes stop_codon:yes gene_type:complete
MSASSQCAQIIKEETATLPSLAVVIKKKTDFYKEISGGLSY